MQFHYSTRSPGRIQQAPLPFAGARSTRAGLAQNLCERFGLQPYATGSLAAGTKLVVLDRIDYLTLVGTMTVLPTADVVVMGLPAGMEAQVGDALEVWNCGKSDDILEAVLRMRLAMGKLVIVGQKLWRSVAHLCPIEQTTHVATSLEICSNQEVECISHHLHLRFCTIGDGWLETEPYSQSQRD